MEKDDSVVDVVYYGFGEDGIGGEEHCEGAEKDGVDHKHSSGVVGGAAAPSSEEAEDSEGGKIIDKNNNEAFEK